MEIKNMQDRFVDMAGTLSESVSINRIVAQLYALLFISKKPVSLDEMKERLNVSKGNVSVNIRVLEGWGAVKKVWVKGSRKDYYVAELDLLKIIMKRVKEGISKRKNLVEGFFNEMERLIKEYKNNHKIQNKEEFLTLEKRFKKLENLYKSIQKKIDVLSFFHF